ncbi:SDR family NAD(P)-dependent oxidoreductase [[Clostridium] hylemonae]|uniref:3-oxoacyl-[acyl-carrier-protein] reductase n=1 Tax=[Clostridium] hylemonae DSM 15053 TaxID=553973 RepID=C0BZ33_9FIRM|nr:SDR family oxidoreductase [[Clostridium] hylemonae]EEG75111.1 putative 3-oxoacyl-[acyl-carrier-protein] reductase [[Clostridium] hylemonae DSM 15053]QEK18452.1 3-oxoacyl-[acyl-carrier-protein] reductase FabG [[Clostridium] hylemonae DSM 15053]
MFEDLKGKVVLLTGASMGLGRQQAIYFYKLGMKVSICARREEKLLEVVELCKETGADGEIMEVPCDISNYDQLKNYVDKTVERFGTIDFLVNNANKEALLMPLDEQPDDILKKDIFVGCMAHWRLMKLCVPYMKGKKASIINYASGNYQLGMDGMASYDADKGAIRGLAMVAARELGQYGIRVNTVGPAAVTDTVLNNTPPEYRDWVIRCSSCNSLRRVGLPETDIPPVVAWLMSETSGWVSGQNINIDGGSCIYGM